MNACRRHLVAFLGCISIMWTELRHSGIFDGVAQWHSLATFLNSLTVFSTCWQYCFPGLPPPSIPMDEYESIQQLPQLDLILEALTVVRIALQTPIHSMPRSSHTVANRYELHRCRNTAYLLICFLQRLISQNHGYIPPFFEVLHFYKTSLLRDITRSTFADMRHLRSLRTRFPDLFDFIQDPGHHQQPCVYLRLSPWIVPTMLEQQIRMFFAVNIHTAANFYNYYGGIMPSLSLRFTTGSDPTPTGFSVPFRLRLNSQFPRSSENWFP